MSVLFKGPGWVPGKPRLGLSEEIPEVSNVHDRGKDDFYSIVRHLFYDYLSNEGHKYKYRHKRKS